MFVSNRQQEQLGKYLCFAIKVFYLCRSSHVGSRLQAG